MKKRTVPVGRAVLFLCSECFLFLYFERFRLFRISCCAGKNRKDQFDCAEQGVPENEEFAAEAK